MSEREIKIEAEVEDFSDELSDEAIDRAEGAYFCCLGQGPFLRGLFFW